MGDKTLHIVMYPWFAFGHFSPFLHLSNKLAERGHKISFLLPPKPKSKLEPFNLHPHLITFIPITLPHVDGLPPGSETTADVPSALLPLLMVAMDSTQPTIEFHLKNLKPHIVFFDFTHWLPSLSRKLNIKSVVYRLLNPAVSGYILSPERTFGGKILTETALMKPPPTFPPSQIKLSAHESRCLVAVLNKEFGIGISFYERLLSSLSECDAIGFNSCIEMEGPYCDYMEKQFHKQVILAGPLVPEPPSLILDQEIEKILHKFEEGSVIYCAFGSEFVLNKDQFQELLLGLEATGLPFFAALKPPIGFEKVELAYPEGLKERVKGRGFVNGGWVQQQLILKHPSVGCFVSHCGTSSILEGMVSKCQLVFLPQLREQVVIARLMAEELKVGVEVELNGEDGSFSRNGICKAVNSVMNDDSEISKEVRKNHATWREFMLSKEFEGSFIDGFVQKLYELLH